MRQDQYKSMDVCVVFFPTVCRAPLFAASNPNHHCLCLFLLQMQFISEP